MNTANTLITTIHCLPNNYPGNQRSGGDVQHMQCSIYTRNGMNTCRKYVQQSSYHSSICLFYISIYKSLQ